MSAIGDHVKKGQSLFTIYSPDIVATQEEYLLALQSIRESVKASSLKCPVGRKIC